MTSTESSMLRADEIFAARAASLAQATEQTGAPRQVFARVATVAIQGRPFGLPAAHLTEIVRIPALARLPAQPPYVLGLSQQRGSLVSVFDLGRWLGLGTTVTPSFMAVLNGERGLLGLAIDRVLGFRDVYSDEVSHSLGTQEAADELPVLATTRDLLTILDTHRLLVRAEALRSARGRSGARRAAASSLPRNAEQGAR